jgi:hypothetical protein
LAAVSAQSSVLTPVRVAWLAEVQLIFDSYFRAVPCRRAVFWDPKGTGALSWHRPWLRWAAPECQRWQRHVGRREHGAGPSSCGRQDKDCTAGAPGMGRHGKKGGKESEPTSSRTPVQLMVHSSGSHLPVASQKGQMVPLGSRMGLWEGPNRVPAGAQRPGCTAVSWGWKSLVYSSGEGLALACSGRSEGCESLLLHPTLASHCACVFGPGQRCLYPQEYAQAASAAVSSTGCESKPHLRCPVRGPSCPPPPPPPQEPTWRCRHPLQGSHGSASCMACTSSRSTKEPFKFAPRSLRSEQRRSCCVAVRLPLIQMAQQEIRSEKETPP